MMKSIGANGTRSKLSGDKHYFFGKHHTEDTKQKIRQNQPNRSGDKHPNFGKHLSEEHKQKISEAVSGPRNGMFGVHIIEDKHPMWGKHHSPETCEKIGLAGTNVTEYIIRIINSVKMFFLLPNESCQIPSLLMNFVKKPCQIQHFSSR